MFYVYKKLRYIVYTLRYFLNFPSSKLYPCDFTKPIFKSQLILIAFLITFLPHLM